jgi:prevent-host-death family protein
MVEIGAFQAKNKLGSLLDLVESGEEIVITRHGRPVARLVPETGKRDAAAVRAAFQRIRERAKNSGGFDWEELKALRDSGRPQDWADYLDHGPRASPDFMDNVEDLPVQERQ